MLDAIDPRALVAGRAKTIQTPSSIVAIGKASIPMVWGAVDAFGPLSGVCVSNEEGSLPRGIELLVGDHPVPGAASFEAGRRVLDVAAAATGPVLALISGGGSALCDQPRPGVTTDYIDMANRVLLDAGAPITEMNLIRQHLSAVKRGGVARATSQPIDTMVIADVAAAGPDVIASGPTVPGPFDPPAVLALMERYGLPLDEEITAAVQSVTQVPDPPGSLQLLADGKTAGRALVAAARREAVDARLSEAWIVGDLSTQLEDFLEHAGSGLTVAAGEPNVQVTGKGWGGRNTHAALLAATRLAGTDAVFASFATDGVDGKTDTAGAMVDGRTIARGGDPATALSESDSGSYLERTGDVIRTGPTGTNVSDVWAVWKD